MVRGFTRPAAGSHPGWQDAPAATTGHPRHPPDKEVFSHDHIARMIGHVAGNRGRGSPAKAPRRDHRRGPTCRAFGQTTTGDARGSEVLAEGGPHRDRVRRPRGPGRTSREAGPRPDTSSIPRNLRAASSCSDRVVAQALDRGVALDRPPVHAPAGPPSRPAERVETLGGRVQTTAVLGREDPPPCRHHRPADASVPEEIWRR